MDSKINLRMKKILSRLGNIKQIRDGGLFSLYSFFNKGISFILLILLAEYISPEQYGQLSIFNTFTMFFGYFVGLSTAGYLSVSYFKQNRDEFSKDFSIIIAITTIGTLVITVLITLLYSIAGDALGMPVYFLYIGLLISFTSTLVNINLDYLRIQQKVGLYGLFSCSFAILNFVLSIYLVKNTNLNWHGRVYAQLLCDLFYCAIVLYIFLKEKLLRFKFDKNRFKKIILWGLPLIPHLASSWMKQGVDRFIIDANHTMVDVGMFSFALNLSSIILIVGTAFNQVNSVDLYQVLSSNLDVKTKISKLLHKERVFLFLYVIITVIIIVICLIFIPVFLPNYSGAMYYFTILALYALFQCIYLIYCNYLFYYNKTKNLMYITFGSSLVHLILSIILTKLSLYYTCAIYVVIQLIITALIFRQSRIILKNHIQ